MSAVALMALVVVAQGAVGAWLWAWLRPTSNVLERLGAGIALGTALSAVVGVLGFPIGTWAWFLPLLLVVVLVGIVRARTGRFWPGHRRSVTVPESCAIGIGAVAGLFTLLWSWRSYPLSGSGTTYHGDMLFFEALSQSLATLGPNDSIMMSGSEIRYHWMTYAWAGQLSLFADSAPFVALTRIAPIVALLATGAMAISWTRRVSHHPWAPTIAVVLLILGGYVGASFGTILNFDSPSQQISTVWLMALLMALIAGLRNQRFIAMLPVVTVLGAATTSGKVSAGAIAISGFTLVLVVAWLRPESWRHRALVLWLVLVTGSLAAFLLWIVGGNDAGGLAIGLLDKMGSVIGLNPVRGTLGVIAGTALLVLAIGARWVGMVWLIADPVRRWRPWVVLMAGMAAFGLASVLILGQGINDSWFALSASAPLSVAAAAGVASALNSAGMRAVRPTREVAMAAAAGVMAGAVVLLLWQQPGDRFRWLAPISAVVITGSFGALLWRGTRGVVLGLTIGLTVAAVLARLLPLAGPLVSTREGTRLPSEFSSIETVGLRDNDLTPPWGQSERDAGSWLRSVAAAEGLIATNRTRSPLVAALTGLPTYLSGAHYQVPYGPRGALDEVLVRDGRSHDFINEPTEARWRALCQAGVRWLWIDASLTQKRSWEPFAEVMWQEEPILLALLSDRC